MPDKQNKLVQFFRELRRRKVIRVAAVYAATAFIMIEAADIMLPRLGLPDWTVTFLIVLLIAGFPISIILSWIFDVTPEGIQKTESAIEFQKSEKPGSERKHSLKASDIIIAALVIIVCLLLYPKVFKTDKIKYLRAKGEISIAVMPFQNLTSDTLKDFWQLMIQDNMVTMLSNSEELKVRQSESVTTILENTDISSYASLTPTLAREVSEKLDANVFVHGSVSQVGSSVRVNAKLVDSETEEVFKSFKVEGPADSIMVLTDSISSLVQDYLVVSILEKSVPQDLRLWVGSSRYPEAVRSMIQGQKAFVKRDYAEARRLFQRVIEKDTNYYHAMIFLSMSYANSGLYDDAKKWVLKAYDHRDMMARLDRLYTEYFHSMFFGTDLETIIMGKKILEIDEMTAPLYYNIGLGYNSIHQYDKAVTALKKALDYYNDWGVKPLWVYNYTALGAAYVELGMYGKARRLYRKAEKDFPGDIALIRAHAILELADSRNEKANEYIDRYVSILKERSVSEASIAGYLGGIYLAAKILDKAEEHWRRALELEPERALRQNNLGWLLIDEEIDIDEGLALVEKALEAEPDKYNYLHTRGWGLYKKGKYHEAAKVLEKAWQVKPTYDHDLYLHLDAARKAAAKESAGI
ncbi:MAG: tetratricopeptide repeat protein [Bacteroidales bacterium]|nr:tetratricopeptide repeat protein [Bacteroidales bacterium]